MILPLYNLLHVLCDTLVPFTGVIVELPLVSSITTVPVCPYGAVLDSRPAFLRTPPFRLFTLLSPYLSEKEEKSWGFMKAVRDQGQHHMGGAATEVIDITLTQQNTLTHAGARYIAQEV